MILRLSVIILVFLIFTTAAMQYETAVSGKGELDTNVNIIGASGAIKSSGDQKYVLFIESGKSNSRMDSVYRLKETPKKDNDFFMNSYMISLSRPGGFQHFAEIRSNGAINSTNTLKYGLSGESSDLNLSSQDGTIKESLISFERNKHGKSVIDTYTNGSMGIESHFLDDTKREMLPPNDAEDLLNKLKSVNLYSEVAIRDVPIKTTRTTYGTQEESISIVDDSGFSETKDNLSKVETKPKFIIDSVDRLSITNAEGISNAERMNSGADEGNKAQNEPINSINNETEVEQERSTDTNVEANGTDLPNFKDNKDSLNASVVMETEDDVYVLPPNIYVPELEEKYGIINPDTEPERFRIGSVVQRLVNAHVGKTVRKGDNYFSDKKVLISNSTKGQANLTRSLVLAAL